MSRVFLARETALGRNVVVKVLSSELTAGLSAERFAREVRLAASLQHPNIVPVLTTGLADGIPYYTMPYVRGESLRARMKESPLTLRAKVSILRDLARALQYAHGEGVIHRDIKPENILLSGDVAVVTDFGIAKAISLARENPDAPEFMTLTQEGSTLGTPAYMAPEQISGDSIDNRADLYSWGLVAYELLSGSHPFAGKPSFQHLLIAQITEAAPSLEENVPGIPPALAQLVMKTLRKSPDARPASATEVIEGLDIPLESRDPLPVTRTVSAVAPGKPEKTGHRSYLVPIILVVIALIAVGGYAVFKKTGTAASVLQSSVAVLPFAHDKTDSTEAYFGEGLADELMTGLAKVPGLKVASRTSAIAMGNRTDLDVREIAKRLGVTSVVEGTVRRQGEKLRVTAQLTNASDGLTIWSDAYDRETKDVFDVQADITRAIVTALRPASDQSLISTTLAGPGTTNAEAYDFYLRGLYLVERRGKGVQQAVDYFSKAIANDPRFARAYAELAAALELLPYFAGTPAFVVEPRARAAAERALALNPSLAEARVALAMAHWHAFRWNEADREFRSAVAADSTSAVAHTQYGRYLVNMSRYPDAIRELSIAKRLDPLAPTSAVWLSQALFYSGDTAAANKESRRSRELDPMLTTNRTILVFAIVKQGRFDEAREIMKGDVPPVPFNGQMSYNLARVGETARAASIRKSLVAAPDTVWMVHMARAWAYLGINDTAAALTEMERAIDYRESIGSWLPLADPVYDAIRGSKRFAAIIRRLGLDGRGFTSPSR